MKKTSIILGLIAAVLAIILAVLPLYKLAFIPGVIALILGVIAFLSHKKEGEPTHVIQVVLLLAIISIAISTYKTLYSVSEVGDTKALEEAAQELKNDAKNELEDLIID